jgi:hypothetical protein
MPDFPIIKARFMPFDNRLGCGFFRNRSQSDCPEALSISRALQNRHFLEVVPMDFLGLLSVTHGRPRGTRDQ